jgi:monoterpene epsilon-lactone hydrolase
MPAEERSHRRSVSRRTIFILVWAIGVPLGHGVLPWAISLASPRHGWGTGGPGIWNWIGLIPIALGVAGLAWIMVAAFVQAPKKVELRMPAFLLTRGPYAYSRNPMYVSELTLWLGWAVFYGSFSVLIGFAILFALLVPGARYEERVMEARFGDTYRAYRSDVPRWLGTRRLRRAILRCLLRMRKSSLDANVPIEKLRTMQQWSDRFVRPPRGIEIRPALATDVRAEWMIPEGCATDAMIFYVHGGGWTLGLNNVERRMLARICQAATIPALAVDYRLAPEQPFPAALEDCVAAYRWVLHRGTSPRHIVVTGISAGGNLALATLMSLRDNGDPLPAAAVCISPITDLTGSGESLRIDKDPAVTAAFALSMARHYAGTQDPRVPLLSPQCGDMRGLPPLLIQVGGDEIILSDATRLRDKARSAGVDVTLVVWPKMWHGWHLFTPFLPEARDAIDGVGAFCRTHLNPGVVLSPTTSRPSPDGPARYPG